MCAPCWRVENPEENTAVNTARREAARAAYVEQVCARDGCDQKFVAPLWNGQTGHCSNRRYCSSQCKRSVKARRERELYPERVLEREYAARQRRTTRISASVPREDVDRVEIAERDGWVCYLCEQLVTRRTWSLDHVIPLSKGGAHTYANARIVHHRCNSRKRTRIVLPLVRVA